jgi:hypothetical protein
MGVLNSIISHASYPQFIGILRKNAASIYLEKM